eukprot:TRINITY_DN75000_c0_g1_i1.p1 TRINITY_DN75000_c0_g1~~TRINITY_DN75000_c0_g1_i1.p1  ORF type:complete len:248 (-),score=30.22 TRINITY_DN75000_c0_g1_i1:157-900(-)
MPPQLNFIRVLLAADIALLSLLLSGCGSSAHHSCAVLCQLGRCQCIPADCDDVCKTSTSTSGQPTTTKTRVPMWSFSVNSDSVLQAGTIISLPPNSISNMSYSFAFKDAVLVTSLYGLWDHYKGKDLYSESETAHLDRLFAQERESNSTFVSAALMQAVFDAPSLRQTNKGNVRAYLDDMASLPLHVDSRKGKLSYRNDKPYNVDVAPCAQVLQVRIEAGLLESAMTCLSRIGICQDGVGLGEVFVV